MDSLDKQCGFDAMFVDMPPELYRCIVCQLVLRDPMLILKCGHRFCTPCLDRFKDSSAQMRTEFRCPIDRDLIDLTKVCEDHGLRRAVGSLVVKCGDWEKGCPWQGDLSELEQHEKICEHRPSPSAASSTQEVKDLISSVQRLQGMLETLEQKFEQKEQEIGHMKLKMQELEGSWDLLKEEKAMITEEMKELKQNYKKFKSFEEEKLQMNNNMGGTELREENFQITKGGSAVGSRTFRREDNSVTTFSGGLRPPDPPETQILLPKCPIPSAPPKLKEMLITSFIGEPKIRLDNHVNLAGSFSKCTTVVASGAVVPIGEKGYYEVLFKSVKRTEFWTCLIGWATDRFLASTKKKKVGDCPNSYGFDPRFKIKFHNKEHTRDWGVEGEPENGTILGVAIDMERGEILYGVDGNWNAPMGVAFDNISKEIPYFPVISGSYAELIVNFGQVDFGYGPPHPSFKKLIEM